MSTTIEIADGLSQEDIRFIQAMAEGVLTARAKYPGNEGRFVALAGEAGEALHAYQRLVTRRGETAKLVWELGAELRQVAQMALRLAVESDARLPDDAKACFPVIVDPDPTLKPHHPGLKALAAAIKPAPAPKPSERLDEQIKEMEAQIRPLAEAADQLRKTRVRLASLEFIAEHRITKADVEHSEGEGRPTCWHVREFQAWLRNHSTKPWCEWSGEIHNTANMKNGIYLPTPARFSDLG